MYELVIIGAGPAGLSAGLFAGLYGLKTLVIGEEIGGQANKAPKIFDYPGVKAIAGKEWVNSLVAMTKDVGVDIIRNKVISIKKSEVKSEIKDNKTSQGKPGQSRGDFPLKKKHNRFIVTADSRIYQCYSLIIATGNQRRRPDYSGVELARQLGMALHRETWQTDRRAEAIIADENLATNVNGAFAAGDCLGYPVALEQISVAAASGIKAAAGAYQYLKGEKPPIVWGKGIIRRV